MGQLVDQQLQMLPHLLQQNIQQLHQQTTPAQQHQQTSPAQQQQQQVEQLRHHRRALTVSLCKTATKFPS